MNSLHLRELLDIRDPQSPFMHYIKNNIILDKRTSQLLKKEYWVEYLKAIINSLGIDALEYICNLSDVNSALAYLQTIKDSHDIITVLAEIEKFYLLNETQRNAAEDFASLIYYGISPISANDLKHYIFEDEVLVNKYCSTAILWFVIEKFKETRQVDLLKVKKIQEWLQEPHYDSVEQLLATRELFEAAWLGDLKRVKAAIRNKAIVNYLERKIAPPLLMAVIGGNVLIVEELLKAGADPNIVIDYTKELYPEAAQERQLESNSPFITGLNKQLREILLKKREEKNKLNNDNLITTPLILASGIGNYNVVETLIKHGADVNKSAGEKYNTPLNSAINKGRHQIASLLINHGADIKTVNVKHINGDVNVSPLMILLPTGNPEIIKLILDSGADVNERTIFDATPLIQATMLGHIQIVKLLLQYSVDIDAQDRFGKTALIWAVERGDLDSIKELLSKKVNLNIKNKDDLTALMLAALKGYDKIVELLIEHGANPNIESKYWGSAFVLAISKSYAKICKLMLPYITDINKEYHDGSTALIEAIKVRSEEIVKVLLKAGVNPNKKNKFGETPLILAIRDALNGGKYNKEIVKLLLKHDADIETQNHRGTALINAIVTNNKDLVNILLKAGANVNTVSPRTTALSEAMLWDNIEIAKILLENGADPNLKGYHEISEPPLERAITKKSVKAVKLLLEHKANPYSLTAININCFDNAEQVGDPEVIKLLEIWKSINNNFLERAHSKLIEEVKCPVIEHYNQLKHAIETNSINTVKKLLKQKVDLEVKGKEPLLNIAIFKERDEIVKLLLDHGINPNIRDEATGESSVMVAIWNDNVKLLKLLIKYKADLDLFSWFGITPLIHAILFNKKEIIETLLEAGANVNYQRQDKETALSLAAKHHSGHVAILLKHGADENLGEIFKRTSLLEFAALEGDEETINFLISKDTYLRADRIQKAVNLAVDNNHGRVAEMLINHQEFMPFLPKDAGRLLSETIKGNNPSIIKVLLKHYRRIGIKEEDLGTGLVWAATHGETEIVVDLLKAGVDINYVHNGTLALIEAIKNKQISTAEAILQYVKSITINEKDQEGNSALYYAVMIGDTDLIQLLLDKGSFLNDNEKSKLGKNNTKEITKIILHEDLKQKILGEYSSKIVTL